MAMLRINYLVIGKSLLAKAYRNIYIKRNRNQDSYLLEANLGVIREGEIRIVMKSSSTTAALLINYLTTGRNQNFDEKLINGGAANQFSDQRKDLVVLGFVIGEDNEESDVQIY
ncbi:uncharacterized protein G2W53_008847 [Senna tora]|uniref:Uncharacterized protein n=1 Tax=Senna tora TaxID=362788 RepID=A0A834WX98_9FABA|nr:uncharacterized protein G2W53_008847 [Senna tora]